jgi:hypothetical protein
MNPIDFHSLLDPGTSGESPAPAALSGRELQELVSPLDAGEFVDSFFSRTSVSVKGHPGKFDHVFGWARLRQALARGKALAGTSYNIKAAFTRGEEAGSSRGMIDADHNQVADLLNAGATICITDIHLADPVLCQWAQAVRAQLNFNGLVGANCYVSPDGSGLPTHYDKRVATSIQIAGSKRWRFSMESAKPWPLENAVYQPGASADVGKLPDDMAFGEVELQPGDLLCLPAGAWHSARGIGYSLALNLYFSPRNLFHDLVPLFQRLAVSSEKWRGGPPATLEKARGAMPEAVSTYIVECLDEIAQAAAEPWLKSLRQEPFTGWKPAPLLPVPKTTPDQRFVVAATLRFVQVQDDIVVPCETGVLKFPVIMGSVFQRLSSEAGSFTIPDVLSWPQEPGGPGRDEMLFAMKMLYEHGILRMA